MINKKYEYFFESFSKFHYTLFIKGWYKRADNKKTLIKNISCRHKNVVAITYSQLENVTYLNESEALGFEIQILLRESSFPYQFLLDFHFDNDSYDTLTDDFIHERIKYFQNPSIAKNFRDFVGLSSVEHILDIGGRARSGLDRSKEFEGKAVTVLDILPAENVDVVCDAHMMSSKLGKNKFDAVYCISVFEHLIMPWKVALEMNKVMKIGAIGLIHSHQTIGLHDMPWDFYRFSDTAWKGLFNKYSGFEILQTEIKDAHFLIPFFWEEKYLNAEKSAGFEGSTVLIRKISETTLQWPLTAHDITGDMYPDVPDNNMIEHLEKF